MSRSTSSRRSRRFTARRGVTINDKHIEIVVRQMLRKVRVEDARRHRAAAGADSRPVRLSGSQRQGDGRGRRARHRGSRAPGRHQGVAEYGELPGGGVVPRDHPGAHRGRGQRHGGPAAGAERERHYRASYPRAVQGGHGGARGAEGAPPHPARNRLGTARASRSRGATAPTTSLRRCSKPPPARLRPKRPPPAAVPEEQRIFEPEPDPVPTRIFEPEPDPEPRHYEPDDDEPIRPD